MKLSSPSITSLSIQSLQAVLSVDQHIVVDENRLAMLRLHFCKKKKRNKGKHFDWVTLSSHTSRFPSSILSLGYCLCVSHILLMFAWVFSGFSSHLLSKTCWQLNWLLYIAPRFEGVYKCMYVNFSLQWTGNPSRLYYCFKHTVPMIILP